MNEHKEVQVNWLGYIKETVNKSGSFSACDKTGSPVTIEWIKTGIESPEFGSVMESLWDVSRQAYTSVEMQFLKGHPEVVGTEPYFKSFEPLFADGLEAVDWAMVNDTMESTLKRFFVFDISQWPQDIIKKYADDVHIIVLLKNPQTQELMGYATFLIRPNYGFGEVKVTHLAVAPAMQNRGLAKLLMSVIFKIVPDVTRIFLCTRVTNETALRAYRAWGFEPDLNPILDHAFNMNHWMFLHYKKEQSQTLQQVSSHIEHNL